jgi:hypothetical protein
VPVRRIHIVVALAALALTSIISKAAFADEPSPVVLESSPQGLVVEDEPGPIRLWKLHEDRLGMDVLILRTSTGSVPMGELVPVEDSASDPSAALVARSINALPAAGEASNLLGAQLAVWTILGDERLAAVSADPAVVEAALTLQTVLADTTPTTVLAYRLASDPGVTLLGLPLGAAPPQVAAPAATTAVEATDSGHDTATTGVVSPTTETPAPDPAPVEVEVPAPAPDPAPVEVEVPDRAEVQAEADTPAGLNQPVERVNLGEPTAAAPAPMDPGVAPTRSNRSRSLVLPLPASSPGLVRDSSAPQQLQNTPPTVRLACPAETAVGTTWVFNSKARDADDDPLRFRWFHNGHLLDLATGPQSHIKVRQYDRIDVVADDGTERSRPTRAILCGGVVFGSDLPRGFPATRPPTSQPPTTQPPTTQPPTTQPPTTRPSGASELDQQDLGTASPTTADAVSVSAESPRPNPSPSHRTAAVSGIPEVSDRGQPSWFPSSSLMTPSAHTGLRSGWMWAVAFTLVLAGMVLWPTGAHLRRSGL